jgi:hypothetical protein
VIAGLRLYFVHKRKQSSGCCAGVILSGSTGRGVDLLRKAVRSSAIVD